VVRLALALAIFEYLVWALPVLPDALHRYLSEFRGGFRSIAHGYAGGQMMSEAWVFLIAMTYLMGSVSTLLAAAMIGTAGAFYSYYRSMFACVSLIAFVLCVARVTRRFSTRAALVATLVLIAAVPGRPALERLSEQASEAKGGDYLSAASVFDRFDLAIASWNALKGSVVQGIGQAALPPYVFRVLVSGGAISGNFIYSVNDEFDLDVGSRQFDSHDLWVSLIVESGVVGIAIVFGFFWFGARLVGIWRGRQHRHAFLAVAVWGATLAGYLTQAEPYILSLTCLLAWVALRYPPHFTE
jgi:hypothetical protein